SNFPEAHKNLAVALAALGDLDGSLVEFRIALELNPQYQDASYSMGLVLKQKTTFDEAINAFSTVLKYKPDHAEAHHQLGLLLIKKKELDQGITELRKATELKPDFREAHNVLGRALALRGDIEAAKIELEKSNLLQQKAERSTEARHLSNAGVELLGKMELEGAEAKLRKALQLDPDSAIARYNLGLVLASNADYGFRVPEFRQASKRQPDNPKIYLNLGRALELDGDVTRAIHG